MSITSANLVASLKAPSAPPAPPPAAPGGASPFAKLLSAQQPGKGGDVPNTMDGE